MSANVIKACFARFVPWYGKSENVMVLDRDASITELAFGGLTAVDVRTLATVDANCTYREDTSRVATVETATGRILGTFGRDSFECLDTDAVIDLVDAIEASTMHPEIPREYQARAVGAVTLGDGTQNFILQTRGQEDDLGGPLGMRNIGGSNIGRYFVLRLDYSGKYRTGMFDTSVIAECQNATRLMLAKASADDSISIKKTKTHNARATVHADGIIAMVRAWQAEDLATAHLASEPFSVDEYHALCDSLSSGDSTRAARVRSELQVSWGDPRVNHLALSKWRAVQAVDTWAQWSSQVQAARTGDEASARQAKQWQALLSGAGGMTSRGVALLS